MKGEKSFTRLSRIPMLASASIVCGLCLSSLPARDSVSLPANRTSLAQDRRSVIPQLMTPLGPAASFGSHSLTNGLPALSIAERGLGGAWSWRPLMNLLQPPAYARTSVWAGVGGRTSARTVAQGVESGLLLSTFFGGTASDEGRAVAIDNEGFIYVAGSTLSADFPTASPISGYHANGTRDVFVAKLSPDAQRVVFSTYLGGYGEDRLRAMAVDADHNVYVTGETGSADFPLVRPFQASLRGEQDVFVTKIAAAGDRLLFSTFLGGNGLDYARGIDVRTDGGVVIAGYTDSVDFPTRQPIQARQGGPVVSADGFVAALSGSGDQLLFSTYLGGSGEDLINALVVDVDDSIVVAGGTGSTDFPTVNALQRTTAGSGDAFVCRMVPSASAWSFCTFLGGASGDTADDVAIDSDGQVVVVGHTNSDDFPVANSFQPRRPLSADAFVTQLSQRGDRIVFSTFLGGDRVDWANGVATDSDGNIYVTGRTRSRDFPTVRSARRYLSGFADAYVAKIDPAAGRLLYSTYLGGSGSEDTTNGRIVVTERDVALVIGTTASSDFPVPNAIQPRFAGGGADAFLARIDIRSIPVPTPTPVPTATSPAGRVCDYILSRVPEPVIHDALAQPDRVDGWQQLCNPSLPPGAANGPRTWLSLRSISQPYSALSNSLTFKCGCP